MNRREFMVSLGAAVAVGGMPAIADIPTGLTLYGDNIHDDCDALKALFLGKRVNVRSGRYDLSIDEDGNLFIRNGVFNCGGRSCDVLAWPISRNITIEDCFFDVIFGPEPMSVL